ncbi:MAG: sensor histidine kinase [Dehalococcoidia bacterium]
MKRETDGRQPVPGRSVVGLLRAIDPSVLDVALALVLTAIALLSLAGRSGSNPGPFERDDPTGLFLVLAQTLPLVVRRRAPLPALLVISCAVVSHSALGYAQIQAGTFSSLIALHAVASLSNYRQAFVAAAVSASAVTAFFATNRGTWDWEVIVSTAATWGLAWAAGIFARLRSQQVEVAAAQVARLELEQEKRAMEAVADERARVARELHDIVGHSLNLIVIQAGGARLVFDTRPDVARDVLGSVEAAGREALSDMERMLGVMRTPDADDATSPQPGLHQLQALADNVAEAGLPVEVLFDGEPRELPASLELTAYRITQEALTNCLKHANASVARVTVRYRPREIEVEIADNGRGVTPSRASRGGGRGHLGMRERVAVFGGDLSFGQRSDQEGYFVRARLPDGRALR